jgi:porphobilinogen synthase
MIRETQLNISDLIYPMFLIEGDNKKIPVESMPGIDRFSLDLLLKDIEDSMELGLSSFCLFPAIDDAKKDKRGTEAFNEDGLYLKALRKVKEEFPEAVLMTDVALDPYSSDGHDGIVEQGKILNDETVEILAKMALAQAQAGADIIGPSDMMDGRVAAIRESLDDAGYTDTSIMSYTAKYASAFYGPFRDALDSAPKEGDKCTYQMDPANRNEALIEAELDYLEGADFLMVKPALSYLDIISDLKSNFQLPIAAYNVSGEYAMIKAAGEKGWIDSKKVALESLLSMKRAGADIILSYFAKEIAEEI